MSDKIHDEAGGQDQKPPPEMPSHPEPDATAPTTQRQWAGRKTEVAVLIGAALALALGCVGAVVLPPMLQRPDQPFARAAPKNEDDGKLGNEFGNSLGMTFLRVKPGTFMMGSPVSEAGRTDAEGPRHEVQITKEFWMGTCEVTQGQYRAMMGYNPSFFSHDGKPAPTGKYEHAPGGGKDELKLFTQQELDEFPVENVSWEEAQAFCKKLDERSAKLKCHVSHRLPTEAEWEHSCKGGVIAAWAFHVGNSLSSKQANFDAEFPYGTGKKGARLGRTAKVGSYAPNAFALHDVHGNVAEWCSDWYDEKYYAASPRSDPQGPPDGSARVTRGGGWDGQGQQCRTASRGGLAPSLRSRSLGFRVVVVEPVEKPGNP